MNIELNYMAVLVSAIFSMAVGFVWYSPLLFAKPWLKEMGLKMEDMKEQQKKIGPMYGLSFLAALVTAYVLQHVMVLSIHFFGNTSLSTGLTTAFWIWFGFIAPVQMTDVIFGKKSWQLFSINTGYQLASVLAIGVVTGLMI